MSKQEIASRIESIGIVPVIRATSAKLAFAACEAVAKGGIPVAEVTMTVPGAVELIRELVRTLGSEILVGAGTVLDAEAAQRCLDAGACFLVSPGFDAPTVALARATGTLIMAGAITPTEVITAWRAGSDYVKIFPAGAVGGPSYIKALKAPLPQVKLVPTGGVNLQTIGDFLRAGSSAVGVGGDLVLASALEAGDTTPITDLARQYVEQVRLAREK